MNQLLRCGGEGARANESRAKHGPTVIWHLWIIRRLVHYTERERSVDVGASGENRLAVEEVEAEGE